VGLRYSMRMEKTCSVCHKEMRSSVEMEKLEEWEAEHVAQEGGICIVCYNKICTTCYSKALKQCKKCEGDSA